MHRVNHIPNIISAKYLELSTYVMNAINSKVGNTCRQPHLFIYMGRVDGAATWPNPKLKLINKSKKPFNHSKSYPKAKGGDFGERRSMCTILSSLLMILLLAKDTNMVHRNLLCSDSVCDGFNCSLEQINSQMHIYELKLFFRNKGTTGTLLIFRNPYWSLLPWWLQ